MQDQPNPPIPGQRPRTTFKKRLKRIAALFAGGLALLAVALMLIVHHMGAGTVQDWIGLQIQDIANSYLNPHLSFTDLSYQYPLTVSLKNLHLTADDPARPGKTIDIIACNEAVLSLAEIPSRGKPIVIEKIVLNAPLITAQAVDARSNDFVGFSNLMRNPSTKTPEKKQEDNKKLSDVFRMRLVQLTDGKIVYDPRIPGTLPMTLDKINTTLNIAPTNDGWYKLDTVLSRKPVFETRLGGQLNLDAFAARDLDVKISADLGADKLDYLPPELQVLLKKYEATGKLKLEITGAVAVSDPTHGQVKINLNLDGANVAYNGLRIPVQNLDLAAQYADGKATLSALKMALLDGSANLSGSVVLNDRLDSDLHLSIAHMVPEKLLADSKLASASPAAVDLDFNLAASLTSLLGQTPGKPGEPLAAISLKNFRIFAADPTRAGQTVDVVACKNLQVAMSQPIITGKPIIVDKVILDQPVLNAIATNPGAATFVGVPNLPPELAAPATQPASTQPLIAPGQMLTDLIQVKTFQLNGAKISYDQRLANTVPMVIDAISTALTADPKSPGLYTIHTQISRAPAFNLGVDGVIDIDHPSLQNLKLDLEADLTSQDYTFLPPQLQIMAKRAQASGKLSLKADVNASLADLSSAHAKIDLNAEKLQVHQGDVNVPIDDLSLTATLADGKVTETARIAALQNVFEMSANATLNDSVDADVIFKLKDVEIEKLLALIDPTKPPLKTSTKISADIEVKTPVMVTLGGLARTPGQSPTAVPLAAVAVHNLRLTTDDPTAPGKPLDFLAIDELSTSLSSLPTPGQPALIDQVAITHPVIRAVALTPNSPDFAGIANLQAIAANLSSPEPRTPTPEPRKLSTLVQLKSLNVTDISLLYNPRIDGTIPMSLDHLSTQVALDSQAGDAYRFALKIPKNVALSGDVTGRINVDALRVDPLNLTLAVACGKFTPTYLPPQVQQILRPYNLTARVGVSVNGSASLANPNGAVASANILIDDIGATVGDYRIPIDHVRLPVQLSNGQLTILKSDSLGGPMLEALGGKANVTGTIALNDRLDATLDIAADDFLLQEVALAKITPPQPDLVGDAKVTVKLTNAPLLVIAAKAQPPATRPSDPPLSPLAALPLPDHWGHADIELAHARLAGFELIQGITSRAQSVFADIFEHDKPAEARTIDPKESATIICDFNKDHVDISTLHYEGEVVAADGKGFVALDQNVNLDLTGGPISKLAHLGAVGNWIKEANDSLLYYHVYGSVGKLQYEIKRGDGKPIVEGAKKIGDIAGTGIKAGAGAIKGAFDSVFHHGDSDKDKK